MSDTQPGIMTRISRAMAYVFAGKADWFGPLQPLQTLAPPEVKGRLFDYRTGTNINTTPRIDEEISFEQLRALSDNLDVLKLVIETRKDQLAKLRWSVQPKDPKSAGDQAILSRAAEIEEFLAYPDGEHTFEQWQRALVDEMLTIDAATIYVHPNRGGRVHSLQLIDGATIKRVLDYYGRTPEPPAPAYQQILKGMPAVDYTSDEMIYAIRNWRVHKVYGFSPVEQIVMTVNTAIRRDLHRLQYYTEGSVPEAFVGVPQTWTVEQIGEFQTYWDGLLAGNTAERRRVRFVPGDIAKSYVATKQDMLKDEFDEWLARIVCYAFSVSPQWAVKQMNRASAETAQEQALQEGLAPLQIWFKNLLDRLIQAHLREPLLQFVWKEEDATDPLTQAQVLDTYLAKGVVSRNEARAAIGHPPVAGGDAYLIYTATGAVSVESVVSSGERSSPEAGPTSTIPTLRVPAIPASAGMTR